MPLEDSKSSPPQDLITTGDKTHLERGECFPRQRPPAGEYHHIPCYAASDFARIVIPEPLTPEKAHKRARKSPTGEPHCGVYRHQPAPKSFDSQDPTSHGVEKSRGTSWSQVFRKRITIRSLEVTRYAQLGRGNLALGRVRHVQSHQPRSISPLLQANDRPDWTEQDECFDPPPQSLFSKIGPLLRRSGGISTVQNGISKHIQRVTSRVDELTMGISQSGRIGYPWGCICFM